MIEKWVGPQNIQSEIKDGLRTELNYDETAKLIGVINGFSKIIRGDEGRTWTTDPCRMRRAPRLLFRFRYRKFSDRPGTSKNVTAVLPEICERYKAQIANDEEKC